MMSISFPSSCLETFMKPKCFTPEDEKCGTAAPGCSFKEPAGAPPLPLFWFPSSRLGTHLFAKLLLGEDGFADQRVPSALPNKLPKQSLGCNGVPQQEPGNPKYGQRKVKRASGHNEPQVLQNLVFLSSLVNRCPLELQPGKSRRGTLWWWGPQGSRQALKPPFFRHLAPRGQVSARR